MQHRKSIFISYRRVDTDGFARLLHRQLLDWFHPDIIYFDQHSSESGMDYIAGIEAALDEVGVVFVLIGRQWIGELAERARHGKPDLVVAEIEKAMRCRSERGVTVIPVLTGISELPVHSDLPPSLTALVQSLYRLGFECLYNGRVDASAFQFTGLLEKLKAIPGVPPPVLHHLPKHKRPFPTWASDPSKRFVDTEHRLDQLKLALVPSVRSDRVLVRTVSGMAGVGKSEMALQFAFRNREAFNGGVWLLPGSTAGALRDSAAEACRECCIPLGENDDPCMVWRAWLEQDPRSWLIIVDDLVSLEVAVPALPRLGPHSVLITTRNMAAEEATLLGPWSESTAAAYLQDCLRSHPFPAPVAQLRRLGRALGGVPLALSHAAAYLNRTCRRVDEYAEQLEDVAKAPYLLASLARQEPVLTTLRTSLERCDDVARRLMETLACFADQPVPERWLRSPVSQRSLADQRLISDDLGWNELIAQLRSFALVDRVGAYPADMRLQEKLAGKRNQPALQLNRLTQQALLATTEDGSPSRRIATQLLADAARNEVSVAGRTAEYACLVDHLVFRATLDDDLEAARLMRLVADLHRSKGNFQAACSCAEQWMTLSVQLQGPDVAESVESHVLYAEAVADLQLYADAKSMVLQAAASASHLEVDRDRHCLYTRACCLVARCAAALENPESALDIFREQLIDAYLLGSPDVAISPWLLQALRDYGNVLLILGRTRTALWAQSKVLELSASELGQWHDTTLQCATALASTWNALGELERASQLWQLASEGRVASFGPYHPETIAAKKGLADVLFHLGKFDDAFLAYDEALTWANLTFPQDDIRLRALQDGLSLAQQQRGDRAHQEKLP